MCLSFHTECACYSLASWRIKWTLCCVSYWICLLLPYQLKDQMNFVLRFILNLSVTSLPAEGLNELYAAFHTEFVCYSLTSWRIKWTLCCLSYLISRSHASRIRFTYFVSYQKCCPCLLSQRLVLSFIPNLCFVFCCKVGCSSQCNLFYVMSSLFHINCTTWRIVENLM